MSCKWLRCVVLLFRILPDASAVSQAIIFGAQGFSTAIFYRVGLKSHASKDINVPCILRIRSFARLRVGADSSCYCNK